MKRITVNAFCAVLTIALALSACAGCGGGTSTIKIGVIAEMTGPLSSVGLSCEQGATLAAKEINEAGGIDVGGRKMNVELVVRDCAGKPARSATLVDELEGMDGLVAIVGPNATANAMPAADRAEARKMVLVTPWSTSPKTTLTSAGKPKQYVYRTCVTAEYEGDQLAKFARTTLGAPSSAVIYDETAEVLRIQADEYAKSFKAAGGTVSAFEPFKPTDKDFAGQLGRIKAADPAVLFVCSYGENAPAILQQARAVGIASQFVGCDGWSSPEVIGQTGAAIEGSYVFNMYSPQMKNERTRRFVKSFKARNEAVPDDVAALSYDSLNLLELGIEKAGKADRASVARGMLKVRKLEGATGDMRFTADSRDPVRGAVILKAQGDAFNLFKQLYATATREDVVAVTEEAIKFVKENGREKALAEFSDREGRFNRGELYIYAYDFDGTVLAHGGNSAFIGQNLINMKDPNGVMVIQGLIEQARKGRGWLEYMWENPQTGQVEPKVGYVMKVDDTWWLGSGMYVKG